jgi:hypothetical protein
MPYRPDSHVTAMLQQDIAKVLKRTSVPKLHTFTPGLLTNDFPIGRLGHEPGRCEERFDLSPEYRHKRLSAADKN